MNRNTLSKDLDIILAKIRELEIKHNVRMRKAYEAVNMEKIEAIINEAMEERLKKDARRNSKDNK